MTILGHTARTEDEGLIYVYRQINRMDYVWRDFLRHDVGIDLVVEICSARRATGLLIAVQVKSGDSYFRCEKNGKIRVAVRPDHVRYWYEYALPVILVVYSPSSKLAYWKAVDTHDLINIEVGDNSVDVDKRQVFDTTAANKLEYLAKEYRNKAKGFSLSYRSEHDEANKKRWAQLNSVLHTLLKRSEKDYLPRRSPKEDAEELVEREYNTNDALIHEAEFLAELIRWDLSAPQSAPQGQPRLRIDALSDLRALLPRCREAWHGSYLEEWLLIELGGLVKEWRKDVVTCLNSIQGEIKSKWDYRCPVCYSSEGDETMDEEDLSYSLGAINYDFFRAHMVCSRCGTLFSYEWGASGPSPCIRSQMGKLEKDANDVGNVSL